MTVREVVRVPTHDKKSFEGTPATQVATETQSEVNKVKVQNSTRPEAVVPYGMTQDGGVRTFAVSDEGSQYVASVPDDISSVAVTGQASPYSIQPAAGEVWEIIALIAKPSASATVAVKYFDGSVDVDLGATPATTGYETLLPFLIDGTYVLPTGSMWVDNSIYLKVSCSTGTLSVRFVYKKYTKVTTL